MVRALLDTCVLSEVRKPRGNPRVRQWVDDLDADDLFVSVITLGELTKGLALLAEGPHRQNLAMWLSGVEHQFTGHVLPVDHDVARLWGELSARAQIRGIQIPVADGLIAATALRHGLHVMTRNTKHFAITGALTLDPWTE